MAGQQFNISFVIGAVDNLSVKVMQIKEKVNRAFAPFQKVGQSFNFLGAELGFNKIGAALSNVGQKGTAAFAAFKEAGLILAGTLATVGGAFQFIVRGAGNTADELQDVSNRLGVSTDFFQTMQYAATQSGVSLQKLEPLLTKFSVNLAEASEGGNRTSEIFRALGVNILDATGSILPMEKILPSLADKMKAIENPSVRNKIAMELFGKEGVKFAQILNEGSGGLAKFEARARELGIVLDKDLISAGAKFNDKFEEMSLVFTRLRDSVGAELFPVLTDLFNQLIKIFVENKAAILEFAKAFAADLPKNIKAVADAMKAVGAVLAPVLTLFKAITSVFGVTNTVIGALALVITGKLIFAIYALMGALIKLGIIAAATPIGWIAIGIGLVIAAVAALIAYWEPIKAFFSGLSSWVYVLAGALAAPLLPVTALIGLGIALYKNWEPIKKLFQDIGAGVGGALSKIGSFFGFGGSQNGGLGAPSNAPGIAQELRTNPAGVSKTESRVILDFNNLPNSTKVKVDKAESPLDLNMGYGMATP